MTARNISLLNAVYSNVPAVQLPVSGGGTATFTEVTDTTATASDVSTGKYFYTAQGIRTQGSNSGGGGTSKNVQVYIGRDEVNTTSYTATDLSIKVTKAGTYKCYWSMDRNTTSGTNGSRLYKNGSAVGTAHTTWTHNGNSCEETLTLAVDDVLTVYARARSTSYYVGVSNLVIMEQ